MDLERHPLIRLIHEAGRRSHFVVGTAHRVLNEIGPGHLVINLKRVEVPVLLATTVVYAWRTHLVRILQHDFQVATTMGCVARTRAFADNNLLPAVSPGIACSQHLWRESLSPLNVKLLALSKLHSQVVRKLQPK